MESNTDTLAPLFVGVVMAMLALAWIVAMLRGYVRCCLVGKLMWDDTFLLFALVSEEDQI